MKIDTFTFKNTFFEIPHFSHHHHSFFFSSFRQKKRMAMKTTNSIMQSGFKQKENLYCVLKT